jgi:phosphoserine phosphatase
MSHVATLISSPAKPAVTDAAVALATKALPAAGKPLWLSKGIAAELPFDGGKGDLRALQESLRKQLAPARIDVVLQPTEGRSKRLYLSDMDSTVIGQECIDELADFVAAAASRNSARRSLRANAPRYPPEAAEGSSDVSRTSASKEPPSARARISVAWRAVSTTSNRSGTESPG